MTSEAPQLSAGTVIDGHTIGAQVRTRNGAATYDATAPNGTRVHLTAYASSCFPTAVS